MDLSKYRVEASFNKMKLDAEAEAANLRIANEENEKKILKLEELTNKAKDRFDKIPGLCEKAAQNGMFQCCVFSIECDEANYGKSDYAIVYKLLCEMLDADNIKTERRYRIERDYGYGEDYIKHDDSYYDIIVKF